METSEKIAQLMQEDKGPPNIVLSLSLLLALLVPLFTGLAHVTFSEQPILYAVGFYAGLICSMLAMLMGLCTFLIAGPKRIGLAVLALSATWWIWFLWSAERYDLFS